MYYSGTWATEMEIFAAADLLQTTIMTFNGDRWNAYPSCYLPTDTELFVVANMIRILSFNNLCATIQKGNTMKMKYFKQM